MTEYLSTYRKQIDGDWDLAPYMHFKFQTSIAEMELDRRSVEEKFENHSTENYLLDSFEIVCMFREEHDKLVVVQEQKNSQDKKRALETEEFVEKSCTSLYIYYSKVSHQSMKMKSREIKKRKQSIEDVSLENPDEGRPSDIFRVMYPVDGPLPKLFTVYED